MIKKWWVEIATALAVSVALVSFLVVFLIEKELAYAHSAPPQTIMQKWKRETAACKTVFTQRFKQSGMKWSLEGGQVIVDLRVIHLSGLWTTVHTAYLNSLSQDQHGTNLASNEKSYEMAA